jgi:[acyl-carrier-protein] S-malonyltransferase
LADEIKEKGIQVTFVSGYSMGIYAALYHAGVYSYETGIGLINAAASFVYESLHGNEYSNILTIGLEERDVENIIRNERLNAVIVNSNNNTNFVLAVSRSQAEWLLMALKNEGALHAHILPYSLPYHSAFAGRASGLFRDFIDTKDIEDAGIPCLSAISQKFISKKQDIARELADNLVSGLNWNKTINTGLSRADCFYECGPGDNLFRLSRFIPGNYRVFPFYEPTGFYNCR